jgi:hypothetical protein
MNTREREHIGRLIQKFAAKAATDDLLILIAETDGLLEACKRLLGEAKDPVTVAWLRSECEAAKTRPSLFLAEIEAILTIIKPGQEHADLYALLELEPGAGREAIKRNYRRLSRRYHPDTGGSERDKDTFIRITQAYQRLLASADSTPGELPTPRRDNNHWRNSVVAGTSDLRRAQKRRNVVVVALLSLTLIFVSLLAARTYNSRVMMTGLKNKGLAFVPPPQTTATTPTPKSPEEQAADVGCAARTDCTPTPTTTAAAANPAAPTTKPTTAAAPNRAVPATTPTVAATPTPKSPEGQAADVGCAARTDCPPAPTTTAAAANPSAPTTKPTTAAAPNRAVPATTPTVAATPTPKSPEEHAANDGYAARTNGTPTPTTTTAATNRIEPTTKPTTATAPNRAVPATKPTTAATPTPKYPEEQATAVGCAARTDCTPSSTTTTAASNHAVPTTKPTTSAATGTENTPSPATPAATPTAILPAEPVAHSETLVSLTPAARKQPVSPAHAEPGTPTTPTAEPAAQQPIAATQPSAAAHAATAGQTAHTESTPPAPTIATTTAQPPRTPSSQPPPPPKPTPSTPTLTATQSQPAPTTTDHPTPSPESVVAAAAAPQPPTASQTRERIDTFLHAYTAAYEQKNLPTFTRFFATNATENGKPLTDVLSAYAELFHSAETLRFTVSPDQYEHNQGHLHLRGRFTIAMTFKDEGTKSGQGDITFRLTDTTPPQVQTLRYTFDQ